MKLSIVFPCYNEEENIPHLFTGFEKLLAKNKHLEIILVNNGSTDKSAQIIEQIQFDREKIKIVTVQNNEGYGNGILKGLEVCSGEFLGWTHADLQTDIDDLDRAYSLLKNNHFDEKMYIKGRRRKRKLFDAFFTFGMSVFETIYLLTWLNDINAQPNIFHKSFYEMWDEPPKDFSLDLYSLYLAKKNNYKISRFDVLFSERRFGLSSWNRSWTDRVKFIKRTLSYSVKLKKNLK